VDYAFGLKALHYYSKKFFAPHLIAVDEKEDELIVSIANDTPEAAAYQVLYRYMDFDGTVLDEVTMTAAVDKTEDADVLVIPTPFAEFDTDKLVYVKLTDMDGNFLSENFYQHCPDCEISYPKANISVKKLDDHTIELTSDTFAKNVFLQCGGTDRVFSDNFFSLMKNEAKIVRSETPINMEKLTVFSVNDVKFQDKGGKK
jgi:beta-mannosidase